MEEYKNKISSIDQDIDNINKFTKERDQLVIGAKKRFQIKTKQIADKLNEEKTYVKGINADLNEREKQMALLKNENDALTQKNMKANEENEELKKEIIRLTESTVKCKETLKKLKEEEAIGMALIEEQKKKLENLKIEHKKPEYKKETPEEKSSELTKSRMEPFMLENSLIKDKDRPIVKGQSLRKNRKYGSQPNSNGGCCIII